MKAIIFDWDGVLCYSASRYVADELCKELDFSTEEIYKILDDGDMPYLTLDNDNEYFDSVSKQLGVSKERILSLIDELQFFDTFEYTKSLKDKYRLFILTNQTRTRSKAIRKMVDLSHFEQAFFSDEIGFAKPSRECFLYVLEEIGLDSKDCLFVDDRKRNTDGAEIVGIKTCLFKELNDLKRIL